MKLKYIGTFAEIQIPIVGAVVAKGDEFDVDDALGESLLAQPTNFEAVDDKAKAYIDSLDEETVASHHGLEFVPEVEAVPIVDPAALKASVVADLKDYARDNNIPLEGATKKADIVAAIEKSFAAERGPELVEIPDGAKVEPLGDDTPKQPTGSTVSETTTEDEES